MRSTDLMTGGAKGRRRLTANQGIASNRLRRCGNRRYRKHQDDQRQSNHWDVPSREDDQG